MTKPVAKTTTAQLLFSGCAIDMFAVVTECLKSWQVEQILGCLRGKQFTDGESP